MDLQGQSGAEGVRGAVGPQRKGFKKEAGSLLVIPTAFTWVPGPDLPGIKECEFL
jgi:hypothetical protein